MPGDMRTLNSGRAIDEDSRRDVNKPLEAKVPDVCLRPCGYGRSPTIQTTSAPLITVRNSAKRKFTSRETNNDALDAKIRKVLERLEDCTGTGAKGVIQLSENLKGLLSEQNEDYDVRIFVKGQEFRAHSLILKARSPVMGMMLSRDSKEKNSGTIHVEDCDPDCFHEFLLFLYSGRTENLDTSKALGLYYAADKYDLPLLKEECVHFLGASLSATSVCDVVLLATKHRETQLLRTAAEYFVKNIQQILFTVEWQNFMAQNPTVANELYIKSLQNLGHLT